jgi:proteasome accessory factor C
MANNPRLARLIDLVPYISKHQGIEIAKLAEQFNVSIPELEKDLWLLYCCGLPGQTPLDLMEFDFEDGYVSVRNADELRNPRALTQTEIATVIVGLEIIATEGSEVAASLRERLTKLLDAKIAYTSSGVEKNYAELAQALQKNLLCHITYQGKERKVLPLELYSEQQGSYLRAFCKSANALRTFKLDRIEKLEVTTLSELAPLATISNSGKTTPISVLREARRVRELFGALNSVQYFSGEWLIAEVLSLGGAVKVEDSELAQAISKRAEAGLALYLG